MPILMLFALQAASPDEVPVPERLFAPRQCRGARGEIVVCGGQLRADRLAHLPPEPDPYTVDKRPIIWLTKHVGLQIGFAVNPVFR